MTVVIFLIAVFVFGIVLNGLFAGYETGFISADRIRIRFRAEEEGDLRARGLLRHMDAPDTMLTVVLIGTNVALIVGTMAITRLLEPRQWLATIIATSMFLVFAEIIPKSVFRRHPNRLALRLLPAMRVAEVVLFPLIFPTLVCIRVLRALVGVDFSAPGSVMKTEEDLRNLIDESAARGSIEPEEQEMIHSVMDLQEKKAHEIMVPRIDIQALSETAGRVELVKLIQESKRTRIPIFRGSIDTIVGVANVYDLLLDAEPEREDIARFVRPIKHVPDTKPLDELLQELKQSEQRMVVVTDEYGGTDGILTLEDVLEEIFGEIHDEHDAMHDRITQVGPRNYVIDARVSLEDVARVIDVAIVDDQVETIGGWVMRAAGRIPQQGEKLKHAGFRITVLEGARNQIIKIRLDVLPEASVAPGGGPEPSG